MRYVIILALLVSGCAPSFYKPNITMQEWKQDSYACQHSASSLPYAPPIYAPNPGGPGWAGVQQSGAALVNAGGVMADMGYQRQMYVACMEARGYSTETPKGVTTRAPR